MEVILSQNVKHLGSIGDVVKVKDGYARNFLIPKKLAFVATPSNLKRISLLEKKKKEEFESNKLAAQEQAEKLSKISCSVAVEVNEYDKLYGAITESEIIKALDVEGVSVDKKDLIIEKAIEELGIYEIGVKLHPEVTAKIRLWVTKK